MATPDVIDRMESDGCCAPLKPWTGFIKATIGFEYCIVESDEMPTSEQACGMVRHMILQALAKASADLGWDILEVSPIAEDEE